MYANKEQIALIKHAYIRALVWPYLQKMTCPLSYYITMCQVWFLLQVPGILGYFNPVSSLPIAADMRIGKAATREVNHSIENISATKASF